MNAGDLDTAKPTPSWSTAPRWHSCYINVDRRSAATLISWILVTVSWELGVASLWLLTALACPENGVTCAMEMPINSNVITGYKPPVYGEVCRVGNRVLRREQKAEYLLEEFVGR